MCQFPPITYQIFCPYTPGQNGVAERKHLHIVELGLAMLYEASMPVEAFSTAIFIINILPSTKLNMCSSYQWKIKPKLSVYVWMSVLPLSSGIHFEFDPRSLPCVFLGYSDKHKGYPCLYPPTGRVKIYRNVVLFENFFPFPKLTSFFYVQQEGSRGVMFIQWMYRDEWHAIYHLNCCHTCDSSSLDII